MTKITFAWVTLSYTEFYSLQQTSFNKFFENLLALNKKN